MATAQPGGKRLGALGFVVSDEILSVLGGVSAACWENALPKKAKQPIKAAAAPKAAREIIAPLPEYGGAAQVASRQVPPDRKTSGICRAAVEWEATRRPVDSTYPPLIYLLDIRISQRSGLSYLNFRSEDPPRGIVRH